MSVIEKKNQFVESVNESLGNAVRHGVFHLNTTDDTLGGRHITLNDGKRVLNFGSCSYLGLEMDERLKQGAIDAVLKYGTQFSSSRAYLSNGQYQELEALFGDIFGAHCIVSPTTTLGHSAAIPVLVADNDAVILDHQVHGSVQNAVQLIKPRGVHVEMIRHNDLNSLEDKLKSLRNTHYRVWYMADGVYSMYGDYAPIKELYALMDRYPMLHLYIDDAHGMSWTGPRGSGYILSQVELRPRVYLTTSLAKAFGSGGGVLIFQNSEDMRRVRTSGSSFVFSGPVQPSVLGACIASAKIHLSSEIYALQASLKEKLIYCDQLIRDKKLPYVFSSGSPIFYIGLGIPAMGYNMVRQLINEGFYVDLGIFPGVPLKRTGLRLAINNHMTHEDIRQVVDAIANCFPKALYEEKQSIADIGKYFRMDFSYASGLDAKQNAGTSQPELRHYTSIDQVDRAVWNRLLGNRGSFDHEGCRFLEKVFSNNADPENNWQFHYFLVFDGKTPVLATFITELLCKDDMLSPESVSQQIENERLSDPYYLTSRVMMMGSLLTEGEHLYLDKNHTCWREALDLFISRVQQLQESVGASAIYLRDIAMADGEIGVHLLDRGFVKTNMPDSWVINDASWHTEDELLNSLSPKSRYHVRREILDYSGFFTIRKRLTADKNDILHWKKLYGNVRKRSLRLNTFPLPDRFFEEVLNHPNWDIFEFYLKDRTDNTQAVAVGFNYKTTDNYCPMVLGIDYNFQDQYHVYRQVLYSAVAEGRRQNAKKIYLGMEAGLEKKRLGAERQSFALYIQMNDSFNLQKIEQYTNHISL